MGILDYTNAISIHALQPSLGKTSPPGKTALKGHGLHNLIAVRDISLNCIVVYVLLTVLLRYKIIPDTKIQLSKVYKQEDSFCEKIEQKIVQI